jgi:flagellar basal-body rod modification protein FlgD
MNFMQMMSSITPVSSAASSTVASALGTKRTTQVKPMDSAPASGADGSAAATGGSSTITSSDFLTLLVSELKNQDPTQPTDPNQYITQLVGVNSLQQLIGINQGIGTLDTGLTTSSTSGDAVSGTGNS